MVPLPRAVRGNAAVVLPAGERSALHQRAAAWFRTQGRDDLALQHLRLAGDTPAPTESGLTRPPAPVEALSPREIEVLALIAEGCSNADIARRLVIAGGTVKRHINNIYGKLGVASRTQAVARSRALGLVD